MFNLEGKTALITGASSGLGKRFAQILSLNGAKVVIAARRIDKCEELAHQIRKDGGEALAVRMNVGDKDSVLTGVDQLVNEKIDILINNAGIVKMSPIFSLEEADEFESVLQTNVIGMWYVTKVIARHMRDHEIAGSIINIASVNGSAAPALGGSAYNVSKAAVIHLTKSLVGELSPHNIRINAIVPGLFQTEKTADLIEQEKEDLQKMIPLSFVADPADLDATILYLSSNIASRYVTGSSITIDGGLSWGGKGE